MSSEIKGTLTKIKSGGVQTRLAAMSALFSLASDDEIREEIRNMGGIGILVGCLEADRSEPRIARQACGALLNLANDDKCREEIRDYGGIELLCQLIEHQFTDQLSVEYATGALLNLSSDDDTRELVKKADGARILMLCLSEAPSEECKKNAIGAIAQLCLDQDFTEQLLMGGALPFIVECLSSTDEETRNRTSGCIWNLSVTGDETRIALARVGCLEQLVGLLQNEESNEDSETIGNCVMCLSILCSNDIIAEALREMDGCFEMIVNFMGNIDSNIAQNAAAAIWNLAQNSENKLVLSKLNVMAYLIPLLAAFTSISDWEALEKVLGAVITGSTNDNMANEFRENSGFYPLKSIIEGKVDPNTVESEQHKKCILYGIIAFAVLAYNDENKDEIRESGALTELVELLSMDYDDDLLEKVTAAMLNLTHNVANREVIRDSAIPPLIELLYHPIETISMNAAGCLWNLSYSESSKIAIRRLGGLKPLLTLIGGGKVEPREKNNRKISQDDIAACEYFTDDDEDYEDEKDYEEPLSKFDVLEFVDEIFSPLKKYERLDDENNDSDNTNAPQLDRNGEEIEKDDSPSKIIVSAARINIRNRRKQVDEERERKEAEERESRKKEREEREAERARKKEEEKQRKAEEETSRLHEEEETRKKVEEEMKKKAEKDKLMLQAQSEQTKNQANESFKYERRGAKDEDIDWNEIYENGFDDSQTNLEAKNNLQFQLDEYSTLIDPFNSNGLSDHLTDDNIKFINREFERAKNFLEEHPNATKEEVDEVRRELSLNVKPIIDKATSGKAVSDITNSIRQNVLADFHLVDNLMNKEEKRELEQAVDEIEQYLYDNPDATKEEIEEKKREFLENIEPLLSHSASRNDFEQFAQKLKKNANDIDLELLEDDKVILNSILKETEEYLLDNPNASTKDIKNKKNEAKNRIDPILNKLKAKKMYVEYFMDARDKLANDQDLTKRLTPEEKKSLETALDDFDKWLKNHPNSDAESIDKQKQRLEQKMEPLASRAEAYNNMESYLNSVRKRATDDDDLCEFLEDTEKNILQKVLKEAEDFLKKAEKELGKHTNEEIDNKKKETKERLARIIEKPEKKKKLKEYASKLGDLVADDGELAHTSANERQLIENETKELGDWIKNNPSLEPEEIEERKKTIEKKVQPIIDNANQRKALKDAIQKLRDRCNNEKFAENLKPDEKNPFEDAINELSNFMLDNPEATKEQITEKRENAMENIQPILDRVKEKESIDNYLSNIRDKVKDDPILDELLSAEEKKSIDKASKALEKILASKPSIKESQKAKEEFSEVVKPLFENAERRSKLSSDADKILDDVVLDSYTNEKDKEDVQKAKQEFIDEFLSSHPEATKEQIEEQTNKFKEVVAPITDRIRKKKEMQKKINELKRKLNNAESGLSSSSTPEEIYYLSSKAEELSKYLKDNPNATSEQIGEKIQEFKTQVEPISKTGDNRYQLEKQLNAIRDTLVDPKGDLNNNLNETEKEKIRDATKEALSFLENNPTCSSSDIGQIKKKVDEDIKGLLEKAKAKANLYKKANEILLDLQNNNEGGIGDELSNSEKTAIIEKCNEIIEKMENSPNITVKEIKDSEKDFNKAVTPIIGKVKEKNNLRDLINGIRDKVFNIDNKHGDDTSDSSSDSDNEKDFLKGSIKNPKSKRKDKNDKKENLGDFLTNEEKKKIDEITKQVSDIIENDPNLSINEMKDKARKLKEKTENILKSAKNRSDFKDYLSSVRENVKDEDLIANHCSENDKKVIDEAINEAIEWLNKEGSSANHEAIENMKKHINDKIEPIIKDAKERGELEKDATKIKQRLEEDVDLISALSEAENKALHDEIKEILEMLPNPESRPERTQELKKQLNEKVAPLLAKADSINRLKELLKELRNRLNRDDFKSKLNNEDKKKFENAIDDGYDFLEHNPNAPKEKIDQKRQQIESQVNPIIKKTDKMKQALDYASDIRKKIETDSELKESLTLEEKQMIDGHTTELVDWIEKTAATASANEIADKERECKETVEPIVQKAKSRNGLKEDLLKLRGKLADTGKNKFSDKEKKTITDEISKANEFLDSSAKDPKTTASDIEKKRGELRIATHPLVQKARQRKELQDYAETVSDKLENDTKLTSRIDPIEKEPLQNTAKEALKWVNKHGNNASLAELREKMRQTKAKLEATIERAEKHQNLEDITNHIKEKVEADFKESMPEADKKHVLEQVENTINWLNTNKTSPVAEIESQLRNLENNITPIMEKAKTKKELEQFANNVRDRLKNDKELASILTPKEKKIINDNIQQVIEWLSENPNASFLEIKERKKKLEKLVNDILGDKEAVENFKNYVDKVLEVLNKNKQVEKSLTEEEKCAIQDFADEAKDWLSENPNSTAKQIRSEKKKLEEKLGQIKKFKFELPPVVLISKNLNERTRWGDESKRVKDITQLMGSYLKRKSNSEKSETPRKKYAKKDDEDMKLFETMKTNKGGLIQAKLQSLMGSISPGGGSATSHEEEPSIVYSYSELKNNKQKNYPPGIDMNKREEYLSNEEFKQVFKMSRDEFKRLPDFRQNKLKRDADLFLYV